METALWHQVSEEEKKEIQKQAKKIMDDFHNSLKAVEKLEGSRVERDECEREEKEPGKTDSEFRKIMFENAPETKDDCIKAEKGKWV
jgi:Asp-tRNA(Asn)/Glu-tRNA(Gln) amidotransferase C subunit